MQQRNHQTSFRAVRDTVLVRDGHKCRLCGGFASTVRYHDNATTDGRPSGRARLNPDFLFAVCQPCQVVIPAGKSGEYRPNRRRARDDKQGGDKRRRRPSRPSNGQAVAA